MKKCKKCGEEKEYTHYHRKSDTKDGYQNKCKECRKAERKPNPEVRRRERLKRVYGITIEEYDNILLEQGGGCAICGSREPGGKGRFHVDHNHESGDVRGLLCHSCNVGIGSLKDSPDILQKARDYLIRKGYYG